MLCCHCSATPSSSTRATSRSISLTRATMQLRKTMFAWWRCGRAKLCIRMGELTDHTMAVQGVFKMLREDFAYQPTVKVRGQTIAGEIIQRRSRSRAEFSSVNVRSQVSQFFGGGYAQVKVSFVCDVIRLCKNKHQALWKKQRDGRLKVETKGYRPNAHELAQQL